MQTLSSNELSVKQPEQAVTVTTDGQFYHLANCARYVDGLLARCTEP